MDRRNLNQIVAENVISAMAADCDKGSVARAADISVSELDARLSGSKPFTVRELLKVGGFLHSSPDALLEGVAA